jgi:hypothetical protein
VLLRLFGSVKDQSKEKKINRHNEPLILNNLLPDHPIQLRPIDIGQDKISASMLQFGVFVNRGIYCPHAYSFDRIDILRRKHITRF